MYYNVQVKWKRRLIVKLLLSSNKSVSLNLIAMSEFRSKAANLRNSSLCASAVQIIRRKQPRTTGAKSGGLKLQFSAFAIVREYLHVLAMMAVFYLFTISLVCYEHVQTRQRVRRYVHCSSHVNSLTWLIRKHFARTVGD